MDIEKIYQPKDRSAEGTLIGVPFDTWLASRDGCGVHFWLDRYPTAARAKRLAKLMRAFRDVVTCTYSDGSPERFWPKEPQHFDLPTLSRASFLSVYRDELCARFEWAANDAKRDAFMLCVTETISTHRQTWRHSEDVALAAWRRIGGVGRPSLKDFRGLK